MNSKEKIIFFVAIATVASTLINSAAFGLPIMAAYFLYVIAASLLVVITGAVFITGSKGLTLSNPIALFLFTGMVMYSMVNGYFITEAGLNLRHTYLLAGNLLLISFCVLFGTSQLNFSRFCKAIVFIAGMEALVCCLQYLGWIPSMNNFFKVTGTWVNPNVTSMFFVMATPALLLAMFGKEIFYKRLSALVLVLVIISLMLLKCRTAFIGIFITVGIVLTVKHDLFRKLKARFNRLRLIALASLFLVIVVASCTHLYQVKQASADGRMLIWKISLNMIAEKPLTGYGYGRFEHDYNLAQAKYFAHGSGTEQEVTNASFIRMAYNEFLENGVEGGVLGVVLFTGILISLLLKPMFVQDVSGRTTHTKTAAVINTRSSNQNNNVEQVAAYAGIAAFGAMSLVNFTVQAIPALCLFLAYAAVVITGSGRSTKTKFAFSFSGKRKLSISCALIILGLYLSSSHLSAAKAFISNRNAEVFAMEGDKKKAINTLAQLEDEPGDKEIYLMNYGKVLFTQKKYELALSKFNEAKALTSDPDLYTAIGNCSWSVTSSPSQKRTMRRYCRSGSFYSAFARHSCIN